MSAALGELQHLNHDVRTGSEVDKVLSAASKDEVSLCWGVDADDSEAHRRRFDRREGSAKGEEAEEKNVAYRTGMPSDLVLLQLRERRTVVSSGQRGEREIDRSAKALTH